MYYRLRVVLVGELTEESTTKLINHYYDHMGRPYVATSLSTPLEPPQGAAAANPSSVSAPEGASTSTSPVSTATPAAPAMDAIPEVDMR
jgi:hypothetical protein